METLIPPTRDVNYLAGDLLIDVERRMVRRGEVVIPLPRLSFDLLLALAAAYPRMLTVDELMDRVWAPAVVNPETVGQRVKLLRHAIGEYPGKPRYVVGVRGQGYRMDVPVEPTSQIRSGVPDQIDAAITAFSPGVDSASVQHSTATGGGLAKLPESIDPSSTRAPAPRGIPPGLWITVAIALLIGAALLAGHTFWRSQRQSTLRGSETDIPELKERSVAVLPFLDMSEARDQQYFADGLTEELVGRLASIPRLHVMSRSSSFFFKGKQQQLTSIAASLGVSYLLEGSLRKSGGSIRITTHIVRGEDGYDVWSETYDRPFADIFIIQDEIASAVVQALKVSVVPEERNRTANPEAYTEFLRAMAHTDRGLASDYATAEVQLHAAIKLDPEFAGAWALLAMATIWQFDVRAPNPTPDACRVAHSAANRAVALGPALSQAHRARGITLQSCDGNLQGAREEFDRALQLQPDDPLLLLSQARLSADMRQSDQSIAFARRATAVDPFNPWTFSALGDVYLYSGQPAEAELAYRKAIEINPSLAYNHSALAIELLTESKPLEAVTESQREPDPQYGLMLLPIALDAAGRPRDAETVLNELQLKYGDERADWVALFYACRHDREAAIKWLQKYLVRHNRVSEYQPFLMTCLDSLGNDPRYQKFKRQTTAGTNAPDRTDAPQTSHDDRRSDEIAR